jgi:hypothetical protein
LLTLPRIRAAGIVHEEDSGSLELWTDDYSNLLQVF